MDLNKAVEEFKEQGIDLEIIEDDIIKEIDTEMRKYQLFCILALRGHSNVQGATDIPTLFAELPKYIPLPKIAEGNATLKDYLANGHAFGAARDKSQGMWKLETERDVYKRQRQYGKEPHQDIEPSDVRC